MIMIMISSKIIKIKQQFLFSFNKMIHKIKLWNINCEYNQLGIDMMLSNMSFEEYCEEKKLIDYKYDLLMK